METLRQITEKKLAEREKKKERLQNLIDSFEGYPDNVVYEVSGQDTIDVNIKKTKKGIFGNKNQYVDRFLTINVRDNRYFVNHTSYPSFEKSLNKAQMLDSLSNWLIGFKLVK